MSAWFWLLVFAAVIVLFGLWWRYQRARAVPTPIDYGKESSKASVVFLTFDAEPVFNRLDMSYQGQGKEWQEGMRAVGRRMAASRVRLVYFVHGTFVGNDPLGVAAMLSQVMPGVAKGLGKKLQLLSKRQSDALAKDLGNYLNPYVELYQTALAADTLRAINFGWSSANHHVARLRGALELAVQLQRDKDEYHLGPMDRVLLHGHSHAGQLFALLTQLIEHPPLRKELAPAFEKLGFLPDLLRETFRTIAGMPIDFVTFGTPPRYRWYLSPSSRLLHFINHRGDDARGPGIEGILHTRGGDYIQQYGISGTDWQPTSKRERELNRQLDRYLGVGTSLRQWQENAGFRMRTHATGLNLLVDYRDGAKLVMPNAIKTFFGHGVYTRYDAMLYNSRKIVEYFY